MLLQFTQSCLTSQIYSVSKTQSNDICISHSNCVKRFYWYGTVEQHSELIFQKCVTILTYGP